jgi:hypothetical protein
MKLLARFLCSESRTGNQCGHEAPSDNIMGVAGEGGGDVGPRAFLP